MRIITRAVLDWDGNVLEEDSFEYCGPISECKTSGSAPTPVNPYEQAATQYGLSTGTADYNAALNRTNSVNPLGSSTYQVTGTDGPGPGSFGGYSTSFNGVNGGVNGAVGAYPGESSGAYSLENSSPGSLPRVGGYGLGGSGIPLPSSTLANSSGAGAGTTGYGTPPTAAQYASYGLGGNQYVGSGAPIYTNTTSLQPWANQLLESPIDTQGIPGMPGGPSEQQNVNSAENSTFAQEMQLLQPQEQQQQETTQAQLEGEGAMPGSAAYNYGESQLGLTQGQENTQAANQAVTTGMGELPMLYGLGSTDLQNQLALRSAPISEYEALQGGPSAQATAASPDISGAFNSQYQGALAGYNANTATNNANTSAGAGLASAALLALLA